MTESIIKIEVRGAKELAESLDSNEFKKVINTSLVAAAGTLRSVVRTYPVQRLGRKQPFKSEKQRRFFFAALRSGEIRVPYRRTGTLGKKWAIGNIRWNRVKIGNNTPYARFVQGEEDQSKFHRQGGWQTTEAIADKEENQVVRDVERGIENYLRNI